MASLVQWLKFCGAVDGNGDHVASGTAYFHVPGSVTQQIQVYADAYALSPISQPVALDAAGRAEVYVDGPCEVAIYDSNGNLVSMSDGAMQLGDLQVQVQNPYFTGKRGMDYLVSLPTDLYTILVRAGVSIGQDFRYRESTNQNCVARLVRDVLRRCISPYDYGAVGDGQADDTVPLKTALNRACATGLPLYLDVGTFRITSGITVILPVHILGAGKNASKITSELETFDALTVTVNGGIWSMRNFSIVMPYATNQGQRGISVSASGPQFSSEGGLIENVDVQSGNGINTYGAGGICVRGCNITFQGDNSQGAIGIALGDRCRAENCHVDGVSRSSHIGQGILLSNNSVAENCYVVNCTDGYYYPSNCFGSVAKASVAYSCGTGFDIAGTRCGARDCDAVSCSTQEHEKNSAQAVVDENNSWTRVTLPQTVVGDFTTTAGPSGYSSGNAGAWTKIGDISVTYNNAVTWDISATVNGIVTTSGDVVDIGVYIDGSLQRGLVARATVPAASAKMNLSIDASMSLADPGSSTTRIVSLYFMDETTGGGAFTINPQGTDDFANAWLKVTQLPVP